MDAFDLGTLGAAGRTRLDRLWDATTKRWDGALGGGRGGGAGEGPARWGWEWGGRDLLTQGKRVEGREGKGRVG